MSYSISYRFLKKIGLNYSEQEYGNISFYFLIKKFFIRYRNAILLSYCMHSVLLSPLNSRLIRPKLWRWMGAKVGKNVFIGYQVLMDSSYAELIILEDNVHIANRCILLCHQRDLSNYKVGDDYSKLSYKKGKIVLKKGSLIGMNSTVMPKITIGEGAVIGACSLVTKDIPAWSVAIGHPAKVVKRFQER